MIDIRNLKITNGRATLEIYTGFGRWQNVEIDRTEYGAEFTALEEAFEDVDDDTYYMIEEVVDGLIKIVRYANGEG